MTNTNTVPLLDLASLRRAVAEITLGDGSVHKVLPINGLGFQSLVLVETENVSAVDRVDAQFRAAEQCVPTADPDLLRALSFGQINEILSHATGRVKQIATLAVPSPSRTTKRTRQSSGSSDATPSNETGSAR